jgi:glycosyltransferase involved in cell wall biosynthesis
MLLTLNIVLGLITLMWLWSAISGVRAIRSMPGPVALGDLAEDELDGVFVSIVVAARDEAGRIEETIERALAQEGVRFEVIAVDDRSTDGTGESLDALASANPALRVEHVKELPKGWLGKCHALHRGVARAQGDWLLFLDADTHLEPGALAGSLAVALREGAPHVTLLPTVVKPNFFGQAALGSFMAQMNDRAMKVNRDHPRLFMGIGAFNLINRETYNKFGGHERLRLQVVDDMVLGLCVRKIGGTTRALLGLEAAEIEYGSDLRSVIRLFDKKGYAAINFNDALLLGASVMILVVIGGSLLGPALAITLGAWAGWLAFGAFALASAPAVVLSARTGGSRGAAALTPLGFAVIWLAFVRSAVLTRMRGGIVWRETFYSLKELKAARLSWRVKVPLPVMEDE